MFERKSSFDVPKPWMKIIVVDGVEEGADSRYETVPWPGQFQDFSWMGGEEWLAVVGAAARVVEQRSLRVRGREAGRVDKECERGQMGIDRRGKT